MEIEVITRGQLKAITTASVEVDRRFCDLPTELSLGDAFTGDCVVLNGAEFDRVRDGIRRMEWLLDVLSNADFDESSPDELRIRLRQPLTKHEALELIAKIRPYRQVV